MDANHPLPKTHEEHEPTKNLRARHQSLVASLTWPTVVTRAEMAFAVRVLSRHLVNPTQEHMDAALRVLRYRVHSANLGHFKWMAERLSSCGFSCMHPTVVARTTAGPTGDLSGLKLPSFATRPTGRKKV